MRMVGLAYAMLATLAASHDAQAASDAVPIGAVGLDVRAETEAAMCRELARTWRDGGPLPPTVELQGRTREVFVIAKDEGGAVSAFAEAAQSAAPVILAPPSDEPLKLRGAKQLGTDGAILCGYGARLEAVDAADMALEINADGVGIYGFESVAPPSARADWPERWSAGDRDALPAKFPSGDSRRWGFRSNHIVIRAVDNVIIRDVTLRYGQRGGIRLYGSSNVLIERSCIERTHSDGIHIVHGASRVTVQSNRVVESGDDCISVVTYDREKHPTTVSRVLMSGNSCEGSRTRGLTVIGGEDVRIDNNYVSGTLMAGILLFPAPDHNTHPVRRVTVTRNTIAHASLWQRSCGACGDITVNDPLFAIVEDVAIHDNVIVASQGDDPPEPPQCTPHAAW